MGAERKDRDVVITSHVRHSEHPGGAYRLAEQFACELADRGRRVHFVCGTLTAERIGVRVENGVRFWSYGIPDRRWPGPLKLFLHVSRARSVVARIVRENDVGIVFGHSPLQYYGALGCVAHGNRSWRAAYSVHSPFVRELGATLPSDRALLSPGLIQRIRMLMVRRIERLIYRRSDVIQCDSRFTSELIAGDYPEEVRGKVVVVPGWVDLDTFQPAADRAALRKALGDPWRESLTTFLSVRRLERRMGLDRLVGACAELKAAGHRFQVLLGGDGTLRPELEEMVGRLGLRDHIRFLGRIPERDLAAVYAAADCFVLPTLALECFGLIVLEAHAAGTPVIATPVGAIPEVMGALGGAWLTADESVASIRDRMRDFLEGRLRAAPGDLRANAERYSQSAISRQLERAVINS